MCLVVSSDFWHVTYESIDGVIEAMRSTDCIIGLA